MNVCDVCKWKQFLELTTSHLFYSDGLCVLKQREPHREREAAMQEIRFRITVRIRTGLQSKVKFRIGLRLKLGLKWRHCMDNNHQSYDGISFCLSVFFLSCWREILLCSSSTRWDSERIFRTSYWSSWWECFQPTAWISVFVCFWIVWFPVITALSGLDEVSSIHSDERRGFLVKMQHDFEATDEKTVFNFNSVCICTLLSLSCIIW